MKLLPPENDGEPYIVLPHFYVPEGNVERLIKDGRLPYDVWIRDGFLTATDGNVIDYDAIAAQVVADFERYDVQRLYFDPWNATQFINDLQKRGHKFATHSDTETIVHGYEVYGTDVFKHLNGMFAIAIWDDKKRILVLARDRMGIKPLYYRQDEKGISFASWLMPAPP